jgi:hypothetical protein
MYLGLGFCGASGFATGTTGVSAFCGTTAFCGTSGVPGMLSGRFMKISFLGKEKKMDIQNDKLLTKLAEINTVKPVPDFVKEAAVIDNDSIPDRMYASPERRMYSIADPASTYLSSAYFSHYGNNLPAEENRIIAKNLVKAAEFYGIGDTVHDFIKKSAAHKEKRKLAEIGSHYALPAKRAYPIATRDQLVRAIDHFDKHASDLPVPERRCVAQFIVKRANEFGYPMIERHIVSMANNDACHFDKAAYLVANRATELEDPRDQAVFVKLARSIMEFAPSDPSHLEKVASVVEKLDNATGLSRQYGRTVAHPMQAIFNIMQKCASDANGPDMLVLDGASYPMPKVAKLPISFWGEALGDGFAKEVTASDGNGDLAKIKTIVDTLPRNDKQVLRRYLDRELGQ